ncbi:MAG: rhamnogalacturonan acetylesterase [Labilibaculum sp.]|nr:rhamnogalacturonan acetylesterase [Labilibaculum sp.]MBI9057493.1 rhamnogalacturonan acetylesterase [Labilibaculum sp.]
MKIIKYLIICVVLFASCDASKNYTIYLAGDSTMSEKRADRRPETGWGMEFQDFFNDNVTIANHAKNGRSTRTFIEEGRWDSIINLLQKDDYVLIQFGHNDESKKKVKRYTSPEDYYKNLCRFVDETRAKEATPILLTPVMRRRFDENGKFYDVHGVYPDMVRRAAKDKNAKLIDMHKTTGEYLSKLGEQESKSVFMIADSAVWENYPNGINDNTHFNVKGAKEIASLTVKEIIKIKLDLIKDLK